MDKFLVITGGTQGIGKALIEVYASHGFDVFTCSRNQRDLDALAADIEGRHDVKVYTVEADLASRSDLFQFIDSVRDLGRPVDVLINNAGIFIPGKVSDEEPGTFEKTMDTNLTSAYHISRGVLPLVLEARGYIFNICSTASITAYENGGSYCISKFGLLALSKLLRQEMKDQGVRVTAVLPGAVYTRSWEASGIAEDRFMQAADIAQIIWNTYDLPIRTTVEELVIRPQQGDIA